MLAQWYMHGIAAQLIQRTLVAPQLKAKRILACARCKLWWMTPEWVGSTRDLPPETQFLLADLGEGDQQGGEGPYALLLPLIDGDYRATLRSPG